MFLMKSFFKAVGIFKSRWYVYDAIGLYPRSGQKVQRRCCEFIYVIEVILYTVTC